MNTIATTNETAQDLAARLQRHPQLHEQVSALLDEVENRAGTLNTGDEAEDVIVERMRQLARQALTRWAEQRHAAVQPARAPGLRQVGKKKLSWNTTLGPIGLREQLWRSGTHTQRPFAQAAQVRQHGSSRRLQRALTDFGADHAFGAAVKKMQEHYGVKVPVERVRTVTLRHAHALGAQAPQPVRTLPAIGAAYIVAEADGTMLPIVDTSAAPAGADRRKFRQVYYQEGRLAAACAQGSATTHYEATLHDVADTGLRWAQCVQAAGWGLNSRIHAIGDGATWIAQQARVHFGAQGRYTLDLYHGCDYLTAAAPDPAHAKPFVEPLREALRASDHPSVLATLRPREEPPEIPDEKAPVRAALRYLGNRTDQLDYADALAHDLPVGSGLIESGHKHVLQARLKQAGAWWTEINAHALCQLRTLRANLKWDKYWEKN